MNEKRLPLGIEDYKEMIDFNYYYVDKTLLIKELLAARSKNSLFLRPRRFGKTLLLSTLRYYFEDMGSEESNAERRALFAGMKIMGEAEEYRAAMTSYPVISLTLKSANQSSFASAVERLKEAISGEFKRHRRVMDVIKDESDIKLYNDIINRRGGLDNYSTALRFLSECLFSAYGKNVIILIDEYDVPLESAYFGGYYDEMIGFIRSFFESALKTNPYLEFSVITGCLRISRESIRYPLSPSGDSVSMQTASLTAEADHLASPSSARFKGGSLFTGLNNLTIVSVLNEQYGEYYGFTQVEVDAMLAHYGMTSRREDLRRWFDGYNFGQVNIYNPWSVLNSLDALRININFLLRSQWANTSANSIVKTLVQGADPEVREEIERLIAGESIKKPIHEEVTYAELLKSDDNLWNFMFFTGYLTIKNLLQEGAKLLAELVIPNIEVRYIYENIVREWQTAELKQKDLTPFHQAVFNGDAAKMTDIIQEILWESISFYDHRESYYHGFLSGLLTGINKYYLKSNYESGLGRPDIVLVPYNNSTVIIFELKVCEDAADLEFMAEEALTQIKERNYKAAWQRHSDFIYYGISFYKKNVFIAQETYD